jgi:hypothetical protein
LELALLLQLVQRFQRYRELGSPCRLEHKGERTELAGTSVVVDVVECETNAKEGTGRSSSNTRANSSKRSRQRNRCIRTAKVCFVQLVSVRVQLVVLVVVVVLLLERDVHTAELDRGVEEQAAGMQY